MMQSIRKGSFLQLFLAQRRSRTRNTRMTPRAARGVMRARHARKQWCAPCLSSTRRDDAGARRDARRDVVAACMDASSRPFAHRAKHRAGLARPLRDHRARPSRPSRASRERATVAAQRAPPRRAHRGRSLGASGGASTCALIVTGSAIVVSVDGRRAPPLVASMAGARLRSSRRRAVARARSVGATSPLAMRSPRRALSTRRRRRRCAADPRAASACAGPRAAVAPIGGQGLRSRAGFRREPHRGVVDLDACRRDSHRPRAGTMGPVRSLPFLAAYGPPFQTTMAVVVHIQAGQTMMPGVFPNFPPLVADTPRYPRSGGSNCSIIDQFEAAASPRPQPKSCKSKCPRQLSVDIDDGPG